MLLSVQTEGLVSNFGIEKAYKMIADAGFQAVDWNIDHAWSDRGSFEKVNGVTTRCIFDEPLDKIIEFYKPELDAMKQNGLVIGQAHAPFPAYRFDDPSSLDYAIKVYKQCILFCDAVGCPILVIHGITRRYGEQRLTSAEIDALNDKLYESLIPTLQTTHVTVCMENLFSGSTMARRVNGHCSDEKEAASYIDQMNQKAGKECFGLCLDTGHLHLLHKDFRRYITTLGSRIKALHVHDNDSYGDSHLAPYSACTPWHEFYRSLREVHYSGTMNFETFRAYALDRVPTELVPFFLRQIAEIGKFFIEQIEK